VGLTGSFGKFTLHPLIYTSLEFALAQNVEGCQGGGLEAGSIALVARDVKAVVDELGIPVLF